MDKKTEEKLKLHSAGATIINHSPFDELVSHVNSTQLEAAFIKKWCVPFYMTIDRYYDLSWVEEIKKIKKEITPEITLQLLGDFNWRTRLVGAYFSAVKGFDEQIDIIGTHFLKSEVCCVGHIYALVLAFFNNEKSIRYLEGYLNYYLEKPELPFDQYDALEALFYLDKVNSTTNFKKHLLAWEKFQNKGIELSMKHAEFSLQYIEGESNKEKFLKEFSEMKVDLNIDTTFFEEKIRILKELNEFES